MTHSTLTTLSGGLILDARLRAGLTQRELAKVAETSPAAIANYELGKRIPSVDTLARIVEACGMQLRMEAVAMTDADAAQAETDADVGEYQAWANAERFRRSVRSVRPLEHA